MLGLEIGKAKISEMEHILLNTSNINQLLTYNFSEPHSTNARYMENEFIVL